MRSPNLEDVSVEDLFSRCFTVPESGCWIWQDRWQCAKTKTYGYGVIHVRDRGISTKRLASRVMYRAVHGPIPEGAFVCHKCDTPPCINPDHLFIGSPLDNVVDMMKKGRSKKSYGEYNSRCKLTEADVLAIFRDRRVAREISADYGISKTAVYAIRSGTCWDYLTKDLREAMTP